MLRPMEAIKTIQDAYKNPDFDMDKLTGTLDTIFRASAQYLRVTKAARNATPSLSAMVAREEAVREYIKELIARPEVPFPECAEWQRNPDLMTKYFVWQAEKNLADRLEQIFPKEGAK